MHDAGVGDAGQGPGGHRPVGRAVLGLRGGRARPRPRAARGRGAGVRHVLRLPGHGPGRSAARSPRPVSASTAPTPAQHLRRLVGALQRPARRAVGLDEPRRLGDRGARGHAGDRLDRRRPGCGLRGRRAPALRRAVAPRGHALDLRPAGARELPVARRRHRGRLDRRQRRRGAGRRDPRAGGGVARALRPLRRRRLVGGRGARAEGGGRPAHLRLRRPRPAAGRARPSRSRRTSWRRPGSTSSSSTPASGSSSALAGVSDPEEKRKIIGREFIRVFEQAARDVVG